MNSHERKELAVAYLSNSRSLGALDLSPEVEERKSRRDPLAIWELRHEREEHFAALWRLAGKWEKLPEPDARVPSLVHEHVKTTDEVKTEVYSNCENYQMRLSILQSCTALDRQTLALGRKDENEYCRQLASEKSPTAEPKPSSSKAHYVGYSWRIVLGVLQVAIALAVFHVAVTAFEKIVFALLVLVYLTVEIGGAMRGAALGEQAVFAAYRYVRLLTLLKDPECTKAVMGDSSEEFTKVQAEMAKSHVKLVIDSVFSCVTAVITAYYLLSALGWI